MQDFGDISRYHILTNFSYRFEKTVFMLYESTCDVHYTKW